MTDFRSISSDPVSVQSKWKRDSWDNAEMRWTLGSALSMWRLEETAEERSSAEVVVVVEFLVEGLVGRSVFFGFLGVLSALPLDVAEVEAAAEDVVSILREDEAEDRISLSDFPSTASAAEDRGVTRTAKQASAISNTTFFPTPASVNIGLNLFSSSVLAASLLSPPKEVACSSRAFSSLG